MNKPIIILNPSVRGRLVKPVTGEVPLLGGKIKAGIMSLKQKADAGDEEAARVLYEAATFGVLVLGSIHNLEAIKKIAQHMSIWPVMGSPDDSMNKVNEEEFVRIGLGSKITTRPVPDLLKHENIEMRWAQTIFVEVSRMRDFVLLISPETKEKLFTESATFWPFKIGNGEVLLRADVVLACGNLPPLGSGKKSKEQWWTVVENVFEFVTNDKWEEVPELRKTHQLAAESNSSDPASIRNYIRSNIKNNLKKRFFTRVAPPTSPSKSK